MTLTHSLASDTIHQAKGKVRTSSERMAHLLKFVPEDKLDWAPSASSRSALRLVAHCSSTSPFFAMLVTGKTPASWPPIEEMMASMDAAERRFSTRDEVLEDLRRSTADLVAAIETVDENRLSELVDSPFGPMPISFWLQESGHHLAVHAGQLAYLQTIWGDLDNHMG